MGISLKQLGMKKIRTKLTVFFILIVAILVLISVGLNQLFLEKFYVHKNRQTFENIAYELCTSYGVDRDKSKLKMAQIDRTEGINFMIVDEDGSIKFVTPVAKKSSDDKRVPKEIEQFLKENEEKIKDEAIYGVVKKEENQSSKIIMVVNLSKNEKLVLTKAMKGIQESVAIANQFYCIAGGVVILIGTVLITVLSQKVTQPIVEMSEVAKSMSKLDFTKRITIRSQDEIGLLGTSINTLAQELNTSMSRLQSDIENKKQLIRNMSHELKTPIGIIKGYTEGLKYGIAQQPEKRDRYCEVIVQECDQMDAIVRQLLQLSQMSEETFEINKCMIQLDPIVLATIERFRPQMIKENITCLYKGERNISVVANAQLMEQVIGNFITNAINHIDGQRQIEVSIYHTQQTIRLAVFNTGKHIPNEDLVRIWDVFYKVDKARTRNYGGHGIGLSIVKHIAERHQGSVGVENQPEGVLFFVNLPVFHEDFSNEA